MIASLPEPEASSSAPPRGTTSVKLLDCPDADVVLQSSDSHEFRVQKVFLVKNSSVLDQLIQADSDHSEAAPPVHVGGALPVVRLPESGAILHDLLTFLLPIAPALPPTLEETMELLSVAQKYEMSHVLVHIRGNISLQEPPLVNKNNALFAYSLAKKHGLGRETVRAARITLQSTLTIENLQDKLDIISGDHLHELLKYHQRVRDNLVANVDRFRGSRARNILKGLNCVHLTPSGIPKWMDDYTRSIARTPSLFNPIGFQSALARHLSTLAGIGFGGKRECLCCASLPEQTIGEFWTALTTFVHENIETAESASFVPKENMPSQENNTSTLAILPLPERMGISDADIVLQSSDFVNFRVHKSRLAAASPFFKDMFSLPQPSNDETIDGLPVVRLSEDAEIVRTLITALYESRPEMPTSYERVLAVLGAAQKYDMSAIQDTIRAYIIYKGLPLLAGTKVFRAYAIAFSNQLPEEVRTAARLTLDYPLTFEAIGSGLTLFSGSALSELAMYRTMCRNSVVSCLESFLDVHNGPSKIWVGCPRSKPQHFSLSGCSKGLSEQSLASTARKPVFKFTHTDDTEPESTLPLWLHHLFMQQIEELKQYFTNPFIKPSSIRQKYLVALRNHSPDHDGCITCLLVHVHKGEKYCTELEQKLECARNDPDILFTGLQSCVVM